MCYNVLVQTSFYVSGFLYHLRTQQILLLQSPSIWSTLGGDSKEGEDAPATFQRIVYELLNINLKMNHIFPVYDYFHESLDKVNYVFYAEVGRAINFNTLKEETLTWVTFPQTLKLLFSSQTKQDVVVGQRVINLKQRQDYASSSVVAV